MIPLERHRYHELQHNFMQSLKAGKSYQLKLWSFWTYSQKSFPVGKWQGKVITGKYFLPYHNILRDFVAVNMLLALISWADVMSWNIHEHSISCQPYNVCDSSEKNKMLMWLRKLISSPKNKRSRKGKIKWFGMKTGQGSWNILVRNSGGSVAQVAGL